MELTGEQKRAVHTIDQNLQLIACAGSGKTEVITQRLAYIMEQKPDVKPEQIVAFTFTNKAGESMKARIKGVLERSGRPWEGFGDQMYVGTIHAFCKSLLDRFSGETYVLDTVKNHLFIDRYAHQCGLKDLGLNTGPRDIELFTSCIEKMVDDYVNQDLWTPQQQAVFTQYREAHQARDCIDFSLLILETLQLLQTDPEAQNWLRQIRYLVVDEYQDVDDLQERLIARFAAQGTNICVVGDDDQTIYQFRGSNADNMISFAQRYPDVEQVRLETNFRCAGAVVELADTVISHNTKRLAKQMRAREDAPAGTVMAQRFATQEMQDRLVAEEIARCHSRGTPYSEIAVLVRKSKRMEGIGNQLRKLGIPCYCNSARDFFKGRYFQRFVETLGLLLELDKAALYACWNGELSQEAITAGFKYLRRVARGGGDAHRLPLSLIIRSFVEKTGFLEREGGGIPARRDDMEGICTILDDYDAIYGDWQLSARIKGVLYFLEKRAAEEYKNHNFQDAAKEEDAVQLMTIHKSKGLEFDTVFLPNLQKGEFPVKNMGGRKYWHVLGGRFEENKEQYQTDLEDERKLFYVAVTRAKQRLYLSYVDEGERCLASKFLAEAAQSEELSLIDIDQRELELVALDVDIPLLRKRILDTVYAGAHAGLKGMYLEAEDIRSAAPAELLWYAHQYGVPLTE